MKLIHSMYISSFREYQDYLLENSNKGDIVFIDFHLEEEYHNMPNYKEEARAMTSWLKENGYVILADVAGRTMEYFDQDNLFEIARDYQLDIIRIDYGIDPKLIIENLGQVRIGLNASAYEHKYDPFVREDMVATHNYYPRSETGIEIEDLVRTAKHMENAPVEVYSFICGEGQKRSPLYEGLCTIEYHRYVKPYVAFVDLVTRGQQDGAIVGDLSITKQQSDLIRDYIESGIVKLPCHVDQRYAHYLNKPLTLRFDTPKKLFRIVESREYASSGEKIEPHNQIERLKGTLTIDNIGYSRYSGEVQLIREDLPADERVNVMGSINPEYISLIDCLKAGDKIMLVELDG